MTEDIVARERLEAHEDLCEYRQGQILKRMDRIEGILIVVCGTIIMALASVAYNLATLASRLPG